MRILVVEDEKNMNRLISEAMKDEKYSVDSCFDGRDALDYALAVDYDVIILDVNLPKMDGFAVVEKLRTEGCISPVLFLTARDSIADKVAGLGAGGDYYLTKPFSFDELRAVVKVMARKYTGNKTDEYSIADLTVDTSARTVVRAGETRDDHDHGGQPEGQKPVHRRQARRADDPPSGGVRRRDERGRRIYRISPPQDR